MNFRFAFRLLPTLPRLAWAARITRDDPTIIVEHGAWVETRDAFFVEGAWPGSFVAGELDNSETLLGSGGRLRGDRVSFTCTTHTMDRLQSLASGKHWYISNSLTFLLCASADALDVNYAGYERDLLTFLDGWEKARRYLKTANGATVRLHYAETITVSADFRCEVTRTREPPRFTSYQDYVGYIGNTVRKLHANAVHPSRKQHFMPVASTSSGYDSAAAAVFAKQIGCTRTLTCDTAREDFGGSAEAVSDSGELVAEALGLSVVKFAREGYLERTDYPEAEFLAVGNGLDDVVMSTLDTELPGTMFFTGFLGDTLWSRTSRDPALSRVFTYTYPPGATLAEFRLRVGFIHVPIPLLTFTRHEDLLRIANSAEMSPWRLGGDYDRPVPRRLVESSGVPREIYARRKLAITQPTWTELQKKLSPASLADLVDFYNRTPRSLRARLAEWARLVQFQLEYSQRLTTLRRAIGLQQLYERIAFRTPGCRVYRRTHLSNTGFGGLKMHWAVRRVSERYRATRLAAVGIADHGGSARSRTLMGPRKRSTEAIEP